MEKVHLFFRVPIVLRRKQQRRKPERILATTNSLGLHRKTFVVVFFNGPPAPEAAVLFAAVFVGLGHVSTKESCQARNSLP